MSRPSSSNWQPCSLPPGSETKILMLAERVRLGLPLWHPGDAVLSERDVLLFQAVGGIQLPIALAKELPPSRESEPRLEIVEQRTRAKRRRTAREMAQRSGAAFKAAEAKRRREARQRKKANQLS